jgi:c-di-GMP-binding flagellar brake protein YcgR
MDASTDKRLTKRKSVNTPITISSEPIAQGNTHHNAMTSNLSFNGLCIYTNEEAITLDQSYYLNFTILIKGSYLSISANAKTVYKKTHPYHKYIIGLQFTAIEPESQKKLDYFLNPQKSFV